MKQLDGQIVLLTGAAGGFGRSLTRLLLREGCGLLLADRERGPLLEAAEAAARAVGPAPGRLLGFLEADLSLPDGADALQATALRASPRVDILINNAGLGIYGRIDQIPRADWERVMQVNLLASMRLTALLLPQMLERRSGHIVNVASAAGLVGTRGMSVYSASKFGLRGFTESLAEDLRRSNVDVTGIYPFFARTPILDSPQYGGEGRMRVPERLIGDPDRIMAVLVRGIKARQLHVYPNAIARQVDLLRRLRP
jgi:NAD(P)-dependent dehydrogenase (short-subunit alcohol dehydrogenase family)